MSTGKRGPVSFFLPGLGGGGVERTTLSLTRGLLKKDNEIDLVVVRSEGALRTDVPRGVRVVDLGARRVLTSIPALAAYLRRTRPRVLISAKEYVNVAAVWARELSRTKPPLILTERTTQSQHIAHASEPMYRFMPFLIRNSYTRASAIVAVADGIARDLEHEYDISSDKIHVIYNPVITDDFREKMSATVTDPWLASDRPVLLAVGRLSAEKDHSTLLKAFARVRSHSVARLMILGDGPMREELKVLINRLDMGKDVALRGYVENPLPYMRRSDGLILSSRFEGLPAVLIEALACGCPVISTQCSPGVLEILDKGRFGRLVPVGDPQALAEAMLALLAESPEPVPVTTLEQYTLKNAVARYEDLIQSLTSNEL